MCRSFYACRVVPLGMLALDVWESAEAVLARCGPLHQFVW